MPAENGFHAIIIGVGQSGDPLARALASAGRSVALIERAYVGGTCINYGCTPTKTMIGSAEAAYSAARAPELGVDVDGIRVRMDRVRARKRHIVESWRQGLQKKLEDADNLSLLFGEARFADPNTVVVDDRYGGSRTLSAETIVINTGCRPAIPAVDGLESVPLLDSTSVMELDTAPGHLAIIGGGYVACEFAQMFRRFGSRVTIVQRGNHLLDREDDEISTELERIFSQDGIDVILGATVKRASTTAGNIEIAVESGEGARTLQASHLLAATGRVPNVEALDLKAAGIRTDDRGFIAVNDRLETSRPNIFAMGDVKGGPAFTHISYDDYRVLKKRLIDGDLTSSIAGRPTPYTVFTDPQLGRIGMTESEARAAGKKIGVARLPMSSVARAVESGNDRGLMKAVVDVADGQILGCAVLGSQGGEIMAMIQIAMMGSVPYSRLRDGIFAHPTLAESLNNLFATVEAAK